MKYMIRFFYLLKAKYLSIKYKKDRYHIHWDYFNAIWNSKFYGQEDILDRMKKAMDIK